MVNEHDEYNSSEDLDRKFHILNLYIEKVIHGRCQDTIEGKAAHITHLTKAHRLGKDDTIWKGKWTDHWTMNEEDHTDYTQVLAVLKLKNRTNHDKCRQITLITGCR